MLFSVLFGVNVYCTTATGCATQLQLTNISYHIIKQFYVIPLQCIYVFRMDLRKQSGYFPIQH